MSNLLKMMAGAGIAAPLYSDDVFSAYTYTGNGSTQTITNGIDLAGEGGMVWIKNRTTGYNHALFDTARGVGNYLKSSHAGANVYDISMLTAFNSAGFSIGNNPDAVNLNTDKFASWTFRNAPNFYGHQVVVKSGGSSQTALFPELTTLGMVRVKRTDAAGSWYVWHRSLTAGKLLIGETTAAEATLGHITVSGTTVTLVNGVIADGTYLVEAWAHDTSAEGIIQCGSFTADGSGSATVTLGWEPQFMLRKRIDSATYGDWVLVDTTRAWVAGTDDYKDASLLANTSAAENATDLQGNPLATGFYSNGHSVGASFVYLAIRRPNKPPTVGTQVYNAIARTGTGAAATVTGVGFAPDLVYGVNRPRDVSGKNSWWDRLRGAPRIIDSGEDSAESSAYTATVVGFDVMDGVRLGADGSGAINASGYSYINHFFRRAPGFFDEVCDIGTGAAHTISHNLTVAPELMIRKCRSTAGLDWNCYHSALGNTQVVFLDLTNATATAPRWNDTSPTASVFSIGSHAQVNTNAATYVTYLFATLAGISKVGSYTGTAATLQINCGFTTGARFVLIKRTDSTGDWYVWYTVRGIIAGNDPYLLLNLTAAEVTTTDYIDPYSSGFEISSTAPAAINASGGTYIYLAIA